MSVFGQVVRCVNLTDKKRAFFPTNTIVSKITRQPVFPGCACVFHDGRGVVCALLGGFLLPSKKLHIFNV